MSYFNIDLDLAFETRILVDSDILIDVMRKVPVAALVLQDAKTHAPLAVSVITRLELVSGSLNRENLLQVESILSRFEVLHISEEISAVADSLLTRYYLSHGLLIPDALIAATAIVYDVPLLSKNQKDYRFISDLKLLPYPAAN